VALYNEAASDSNHLIFMTVEWDEKTFTPSSQGEYLLAFPRVELGTAPGANYVYYSFYNPSGSGRTAVVKRIGVRIIADAAALYIPFTVRRFTGAPSAGTAIAAANVPKKHTGSPDTAMDLRYNLGVTPGFTWSGTADSRLLSVVTPGAAGQYVNREIVFGGDDEKLILQPGEGIAFYSEAAGDIDHHFSAYIEWAEVSTAPSPKGEYLLSIGPINGSTTMPYTYASILNPAGSGKYAIVKRIEARVSAAAAATYIPMSVRRITAASGGTQIAAANVPKKHTGSPDTAMDIRHTGPTVTFAGATESRILGITSEGAVGQQHGWQSLVFVPNEPLVLKPGEGIALYQESGTGNTGHRVILLVEWAETTTAPSAERDYVLSIGPVTGTATAGDNFASFFNPADSNNVAVIKKMMVMVVATTTATYVPITVRRISSATGATSIPPDNVPRKHTDAPAPALVARYGNATVIPVGEATSRLVSVTSPGAAGAALTPQITGVRLLTFEITGPLLLLPGEGIVLYQEGAGSTAHVHRLFAEWREIPKAYRVDVRHDITDIPSGTGHILEIKYYTAGDSEPISLYLYNFSTGQWDNLGNLQVGGSAGSPLFFSYNLTGTSYLSGGNVYARYIQRDNDSIQTSLMVDFCRVVVYGPGRPQLASPKNNENLNDNTPAFAWTASDNHTGYRLVISPYSNFSENVYDNSNIPPALTSLEIENQLPDNVYYWKVAATGAGYENWSDNVWKFTVDTHPPTAPPLVSPENNTYLDLSEAQVELKWNPSTDALTGVDNYRIYVDEGLVEVDNTVTSYSHTFSLGEHTWRVGAVDYAGNENSSPSRVLRICTWRVLDSWTENLSIPPSDWFWLESWLGGVSSPVAGWSFLDSWSCVLPTKISWAELETWTEVLEGGASWRSLETWTGAGVVQVGWQTMEVWSETLRAPGNWWTVDEWMGAMSVSVSWWTLEVWESALHFQASWRSIEEWAVRVEGRGSWASLEQWTEVLGTTAAWQMQESWASTVGAPSSWLPVEEWTGKVSAPAHWLALENWSVELLAQAGWRALESWSGVVWTAISWQTLDAWTTELQTQASWQPVDAWSVVAEGGVSWQPLEVWTWTVEGGVAWQPLDAWMQGILTGAFW
ncbi:MAG: hypothetical protein QW356_08705, partial [Candidatus Hadarchaeales archaeon]